jgi:ankyrin repeat protein
MASNLEEMFQQLGINLNIVPIDGSNIASAVSQLFSTSNPQFNANDMHQSANIIQQQINSNHVSPNGFNSLHKAAEIGWAPLCDALLNSGKYDINQTTSSGKTPIEIATEGGFIDTVRVLLHHNAQVNGNTLLVAVSSGKKELVELILNQGVDINYDAGDGVTAIMIACRQRYFGIIKLLVSGEASLTNTLDLHITECVIRNTELRKFNIDDQLKIIKIWDYFKDPKGNGSISYPVESDTTLLACITMDSSILVDYCIANGCNPNAVDSDGVNGIRYAVSKCMIEKLIHLGTSIDNDYILLHYVRKNNTSIVKLLLKSGVKKDVVNSNGHNPAELAILKMNVEMLDILHSYDIKPTQEFLKDIIHRFVDDTPFIKFDTPHSLTGNEEPINEMPAVFSNSFGLFNRILGMLDNTDDLSEETQNLINKLSNYSVYYE